MPTFSFTGTCGTPASWYSTGSSTVRIFSRPVRIISSAAYSVVVFPDPVGPVASTIPCGRETTSVNSSSVSGAIPSSVSEIRPRSFSSSRSTTLSPPRVGTLGGDGFLRVNAWDRRAQIALTEELQANFGAERQPQVVDRQRIDGRAPCADVQHSVHDPERHDSVLLEPVRGDDVRQPFDV